MTYCKNECGNKLRGLQRKWCSKSCRGKWYNRTSKKVGRSIMIGNNYGNKNKGKQHSRVLNGQLRYDWIIDY